ncbi:type II toxin-antitoxin system ParD family antitoxin [Massilia sp. R2A-15]|uniref:type II toxin-antitoxin system ParD family antitoxin n=1 Tax=Massilia sp. R2A-15 TaxID=3064278 RepID=UPI002732D615|nr:type II toxin-antitoxin system ParD family antitoxin [Massilia sp. R2A-15]WLI90644.1 type II toxin-antitoxin system ParD family antitoxin [Massilia sp. R2A-15]
MGMNINLTPHLEEMVRQKVDSGWCTSASEVVREALRLMEEKHQLLGAKLNQLRCDLQEGLHSGAPRHGIQRKSSAPDGPDAKPRLRMVRKCPSSLRAHVPKLILIKSGIPS